MAKRGLAGRVRRRKIRTTIPDPEANTTTVDRLGPSFDPESVALDRIYLGDITYIRTHEGWLCLATCLDLASRRVVGFSMADHMRASLVCDAMDMAIRARHPDPGFMFHSDRRSQYTSGDFRKLLGKHKGLQSLSRPRQCWDNAVAESSSPRSRKSSYTARRSPRELPLGRLSSSSLRSSNTAAGYTPHSAISPLPSTRSCGSSKPKRRNETVRRTGASPLHVLQDLILVTKMRRLPRKVILGIILVAVVLALAYLLVAQGSAPTTSIPSLPPLQTT
jgi:transposase InsO family protein